MASVSRKIYCNWVENALKALGRATPPEVYDWIRANEAVPVSEVTGMTSDGENLFKKNVRWARFTLFKAGVVSKREGYGIWTLV